MNTSKITLCIPNDNNTQCPNVGILYIIPPTSIECFICSHLRSTLLTTIDYFLAFTSFTLIILSYILYTFTAPLTNHSSITIKKYFPTICTFYCLLNLIAFSLTYFVSCMQRMLILQLFITSTSSKNTFKDLSKRVQLCKTFRLRSNSFVSYPQI